MAELMVGKTVGQLTCEWVQHWAAKKGIEMAAMMACWMGVDLAAK